MDYYKIFYCTRCLYEPLLVDGLYPCSQCSYAGKYKKISHATLAEWEKVQEQKAANKQLQATRKTCA